MSADDWGHRNRKHLTECLGNGYCSHSVKTEPFGRWIGINGLIRSIHSEDGIGIASGKRSKLV